MTVAIDKEIILKYDKPGPRYTSYPTAPVWSEDVNDQVYVIGGDGGSIHGLRHSNQAVVKPIHKEQVVGAS